MKFGVYIGPIFPGEMGAADAFDFALRMARTAHESGFDGIFAAHHYALGPSHQMFHPFSILARLAADCPGSYLGTACFILPLAHPLGVAEATATLDVISGGRLLFGVGRGYRVPEFQSFGISRRERGARLVEAVAAVRTLWADDPASYEGRFYRFAGVSISPKPIQRPGPPVWVGADTVESVARVPEFGDAWIASGRHTRTFIREALPGYRKRLEELGRPFDGVPMFREMHVATDSRRAEEEMKESFRALYESYARWGQPGERYDLDFDELREESWSDRRKRSPSASMSTATSSPCPSCGSASISPAWIRNSPWKRSACLARRSFRSAANPPRPSTELRGTGCRTSTTERTARPEWKTFRSAGSFSSADA
jgi:alkanesulfonate monooxygenase SsuD/methylene tetrahydromethanopterin reductase-like flavin-dependent oxidoreductase (luciferase family)